MEKTNAAILIVEDDRSTARMIESQLLKSGYTVASICATGQTALELFESNKIDLVLMDIGLEGELDGIETAEKLQESRPVPVIYLTSTSDDETISRAKSTHPYGYIIKPIESGELKTTIELALVRFHADSQIRKNEQKYSTILNSIADAVIVTNGENMVGYFNASAEKMLGWNPDEILNHPLDDFLVIEENQVEGNSSDRVSQLMRFTVHDRNNNILPIEITRTPVVCPHAASNETITVLRDNRSRVEAEINLQETMTRLRQAMGGTIQAMANTVESRDPYTAGHQRRVTNLARRIAQEMELENYYIEGIRLAGVIHDLGKISVPAEILSKPGKLHEVEFSLIKLHPQIGYDILKGIEFPWPVADIVHQHHERMDGKGYPLGLTGDMILLEARIISVADVVEAMASHRPYRAALGIETALGEIEKNRGAAFDSDVVDACLRLFREKGFCMDSDQMGR